MADPQTRTAHLGPRDTVQSFTAEEAERGYAMRQGVKVYCCYGMYCDAGHSGDCKHAAPSGDDRATTPYDDGPFNGLTAAAPAGGLTDEAIQRLARAAIGLDPDLQGKTVEITFDRAALMRFARAVLAEARPAGVDAEWVEKRDEVLAAAQAWGDIDTDAEAAMLAAELRLSNAIVDYRQALRRHLSTPNTGGSNG